MSSPPEDRKPDFSNFPRGAIGIKGLPVSRNARLPSIRQPRDLTLGAQTKRTFLPNIPVRRTKRSSFPGKDTESANSQNIPKVENKSFSPKIPERGRGRGRGRGQIIQTEGSIFGDGIVTPSKARQRESNQRNSSGKVSSMKKEKPEVSMLDMSRELDLLLRDDFIDDGDDDEKPEMKPLIFPPQEDKKEGEKKIKTEKIETQENFNQDFAKELGYDVTKIAAFIKKEKDDDDHVTPAIVADYNLPKSKITELLTSDQSQFLLLRFPECITAQEPNCQQKRPSSTESVPPIDQKKDAVNLSSLPEGLIGKLQIMKSGCSRLVIGSMCYYLDSISLLKGKHEVASVSVNSDSGDIALLGNVEETLNFAPDIDSILS